MEVKIVDPHSLVDNPEKARRTRSSPQADALLLATIRAVGIVQPPIVAPQTDGGNGFVIQKGHRRIKQPKRGRGWSRRCLADEASRSCRTPARRSFPTPDSGWWAR